MAKKRTYSDQVEDPTVRAEIVVEPLKLTKPVRGRRREITSAEIDAFCRALDAPATFEVACGIVGVPPRTMRDWLAKGEAEDCEDEILLELAQKYSQTMGGGKRAALMNINWEHAADDPRTAKWLSEVLLPGANIAKNVKVEATVEAKPTTRIPFELMTPEEMRIVEAYERAVARVMALGG